MIQDQRDSVQKAEPLDIIEQGSFLESCLFFNLFISGDLSKLKDLCRTFAFVADGRFLEGFDPSYGKRRLFHRSEDIPHSLAVQGLYIAVRSQLGDRPAHGIAGTVIFQDKRIFRRKHLLIRIGFCFNLFF